MILLGDLLRAQMFLYRHRVVRAAFDRRVVGDDDAVLTFDDADAGDHSGRGRAVIVHVECCQRRELEKGGTRVDEKLDALPRGHLIATPVFLEASRPPPARTAMSRSRSSPTSRSIRWAFVAKLSERRSNRDSNSAIAAPFGAPRLEPG